MPFLMLENVRSGVNELAVRCSTSIKAFRFAGNGAFCRRAHGKQFCDKANGVIMYAKEVVEQIGEGLEEDGSVPFFDADMLPDGLAELYKLCTLLRHMCSAPDDEGRLQFSHRSFFVEDSRGWSWSSLPRFGQLLLPWRRRVCQSME